MSAKSGDKVDATFYSIAADLSGISLTGAEVTSFTKVVTAELIDHERHEAGVVDPHRKGSKKVACSVM